MFFGKPVLRRRRKGMCIYKYIVNPCVARTRQSGAERKLLPIPLEQEATLFEQPFRAPEANASRGCRLEQHGWT